MKTTKSLFWVALVALTVIIGASADETNLTQDIAISDITSETEWVDLVWGSNCTQAADGNIRAAGTGKELNIGDGDSTNSADVTFVQNVLYGVRIYYDRVLGEAGIALNQPNSSEDLVITTPNRQFNAVSVVLRNVGGPIIPDFTLTGNSINGTSFRDLDASSHGVAEEFFDGILFEFVGNDETNQESFEILGTMQFSAPFGAGGDTFRIDVHFCQLPETQTGTEAAVVTTQSAEIVDGAMRIAWGISNPSGVETEWHIEASTNLMSAVWQDLGPVVPTNDTIVVEELLDSGPKKFFRLVEYQP